jgi:hypothetical protein
VSGEHVQTYDERTRRGWCSCGSWRTYDVTRDAYERAARRHAAWHAQRDRQPAPPPRRVEPDLGLDFGVFADAAAAIRGLPTTVDTL